MEGYEIFNCFYFGETEKIKEFVLFDIYKKIYQIVLDYLQAESEQFFNEIDPKVKKYYIDPIPIMFLYLSPDITILFEKLNSEFIQYLSKKINNKLDEIYNLIFIENENSISKEQKKKLNQIRSIHKKTKFGFLYLNGKNSEVILEENYKTKIIFNGRPRSLIFEKSCDVRIEFDRFVIDSTYLYDKINLGFRWLEVFNRAIKIKIKLGNMFSKKHGKINQQEEEKRENICFNILFELRERKIFGLPIISVREICKQKFFLDKEVQAVYKNPEALIKQMQRLLNAFDEKDLTYKVKK